MKKSCLAWYIATMGKKKKHNKTIRKFDCDQDLVAAFLEEGPQNKTARQGKDGQDGDIGSPKNISKNRHGLPVLEEDIFSVFGVDPAELAASTSSSLSHPSEADRKGLQTSVVDVSSVQPVPLKKRLKRYPPVEAQLDLHGFTALGAELKARSFIQNHFRQGYFTLRIIVGRGLHSSEGAVLPDLISDLLSEMKKQGQVLAFSWDKKKKSASGAIIVYLNQFGDPAT